MNNVATTKPFLSNMKTYSKQNEPIQMITAERMERQRINRLKSWVTFYRKNPCFFIEHYLGIHLYPYQRFWVNLMPRCTEFVSIASRASAKSWLIGVYSMARCILYPGTTIAIASSTKAQAGLIISEKCKLLANEHPNLNREISRIVTNQNKWEITFKNGSKINVVVSGEAGRGHRSNITILEERRLISNEIIDAIIRPFLVSRQPPYMNKLKYSEIKELKEEPQEIIITSAHYKSYEWYPEIKMFIKKMAEDDRDYMVIFLDYQISIRHNIKTAKQINRERDKIDPITFIMEYGNIAYGSSAKSFFKLRLFNRNIKRSWRPITDEIYLAKEENKYNIPKISGEKRIVSVDIAMRAGSTNDNTIIMCARLLPTLKGWKTEVVYIESHNGKNTTLQALRIKQIYEEFKGDVLVLDIANAGISVFDTLSSVTKDEIRNLEYEGYTVLNSEYVEDTLYDELTGRTLAKEAKPCVFPIYASATLNSQIAVKFRERLKNKLVSFLVDDNTEEEFLISSGNKDIIDQYETELRAYLLQAHIQTSLLINECISLEMATTGAAGLIKLVEPEGARKDRYTACSYMNYYVSLMDNELLGESYTSKEGEEAIMNVTLVY